MKTFIYMKETENRAIVEEEETIYEYIYVYIKLGKINILIKGIFLYCFGNVFLMYILKWVQYHMKYAQMLRFLFCIYFYSRCGRAYP